jgi:hypothetical protein
MLRKKSGSAITEMGPALFILIFVGVFPLLDLIFAGSAYCACVLLNNLELREASRIPASQLDNSMTQVAQNWKTSGIGQFAGILGDPQTQYDYSTVRIDGSATAGNEVYVNVATTVTLRPFMPIPFLNSIPVLGAPVTYIIHGRRLLANAALANM